MTNDTKAVGKNGELVSVTEMAVDVLLFGIRTRGSAGRHDAVSHAVRINVRTIFIEYF